MDYTKIYQLVSTVLPYKFDKAEFNQAFNSIELLSSGEYLIKVCGVIIWFNSEYSVTRYCFNWNPPRIGDEDTDYCDLVYKMREKGLI